MSWTEFKETATWLRDICTGLAALSAVFYGAIGLNAWHRQLKGKSSYDVSSKLLLQLRRLVQSIEYLRNGYISPGEQSAAMKAANYDSEQLQRMTFQEKTELAIIAAYEVRYNETRVIALSLNDCHLEYQVTCGNELDDLLKAINRQVTDLMHAVRNHVARIRPYGISGQLPSFTLMEVDRDKKNTLSA